MAKVWKIAPGKHADHWDMCRERGCILIGWNFLKDYREFKDEKAILKALPGGRGNGTGAARSIYRFTYDVKPPHVVVANKGKSSVEGIGIIASEYLPPSSPKNPSDSEALPHARLVQWRITQRIDLGRFFFGEDTVHLVNGDKVSQIKQAYLAKYPELKETLDELFEDGSAQSTLIEDDLEEIARRKDIDSTEKKTLTLARLGQGRFREDVLRDWGNCCSVTGSKTHQAIRASHIKPWCESTHEQRLDANNGLPLVASLDALFDKGLISFETSGRLIVSSSLNPAEREIFGIAGEKSLNKKPTAKTAEYLAAHRRKHGFKE